MRKVTMILTEKKAPYDVEAQKYFSELKNILMIENLQSVRLFNRYLVSGIDESTLSLANATIFSEPPVDNLYHALPDCDGSCRILTAEFLPGQYDQRADSCEQCIQILTQKERPKVKTAKVYMLIGDLTDEEYEKIRDYTINPVESREGAMDIPLTLDEEYDVPRMIETITGFIEFSPGQLNGFLSEYGLAMDIDDLKLCQQYFKNEERRDPTITEIRMLDTYWSDHCRHTTFLTEIDDAAIEDERVKKAFEHYISVRKEVYGERKKPVTLMDIATIGAKYLKKKGILQNLDESEEINACSVKVDIEVDGQKQDWLLMFKNETHNHPTEIEPFGGAATCLGGAIRDPLSGRSYVYQAMRVTGSADPNTPFRETLKGKLPQRVITTAAAAGYSSYGNQIGLATGLVDEVYHPDYVAKRLEVGAVIGAAPAEHVKRLKPKEGDVVILIGGRTGRDGCGGATGSSKSHTTESLTSCGAEVQKGNPPEERKIQRLFRSSEVSRLIKRCNDFGAGGVSVAVGELADGLLIDLSAVPKKYEGLDGTELAISESQERMAVVVDKDDADTMIALARKENLEATKIAVVTTEPRLKMVWNGNTIVDISREFIDSNGASKRAAVSVEDQDTDLNKISFKPVGVMTDRFKTVLSDLNVCSKQGLSERFDSTIGAGSVVMPFGGITQKTPSQYMSALFPVLQGRTDDASIMAYAFNPYISKFNPFLGAVYAVTESIAKVIAAGGSLDSCWLTLQEYFERTKGDPIRWGKPFSALLGAFTAQLGFGVGAIGGKDSMSGTFNELDVPPTLISFAVSVAKTDHILPNHFSRAGSKVLLAQIPLDEHHIPVFDEAKKIYRKITGLIKSGNIRSAYVCTTGGIGAAIAKMCFGNKIGFAFSETFDPDSLFDYRCGSVILEVEDGRDEFPILGETIADPVILCGKESAEISAILSFYEKPLSNVFPLDDKGSKEDVKRFTFTDRMVKFPAIKAAKPRIFIPVFPGTNCEYDTQRKFMEAGGEPILFVFKNLTPSDIRDSIDEMSRLIGQSQILMIPGGFSGGDEPDGSGKFIAAIFKNAKIAESINHLIANRDGLALGICNGFQALVKIGLLPFGEIRELAQDSPTLTFNTIGRHQSKYVYTRISSVKSPWFAHVNAGDIHAIPISHGEGRFVANQANLDQMVKNGQIATQYVDLNGNPTMDIRFNPNGSCLAIEGITSPDGRILGKMGHSERHNDRIAKNIIGNKDQKLFSAGVQYFK